MERPSTKVSRRSFLAWAGLLGAGVATGVGLRAPSQSAQRFVVRPPGALRTDTEFLAACIRCSQCAMICPNSAIKSAGLEHGLRGLFAPYVAPREQACMLCMKCTEVCPTDALTPISSDTADVLTRVDMGKAVVDKAMCYSYNGRTYGVCYRACPFPGVSMKIGLFEKPIVTDQCVGCGLCERACVHVPQAIRIVRRA